MTGIVICAVILILGIVFAASRTSFKEDLDLSVRVARAGAEELIELASLYPADDFAGMFFGRAAALAEARAFSGEHWLRLYQGARYGSLLEKLAAEEWAPILMRHVVKRSAHDLRLRTYLVSPSTIRIFQLAGGRIIGSEPGCVDGKSADIVTLQYQGQRFRGSINELAFAEGVGA